MQKAADDAGVKFRPHTKVHESLEIAKMQLNAGASGIEVGPLAQAEIMADGGVRDILVAHPFYGESKFEILTRLLARPNLKLSFVVDMVEQAEAISKVAQTKGRRVPVLVKLETGIDRYGVPPGQPAVELAMKIRPLPGVEVAGIYAHEVGAKPTEEGLLACALEIGTKVCHTARMLKKEGFNIDHVSVGASPTHFATCRLIKEGKLPEITELHPGNSAIGDVRYMAGGANTLEEIALTVLVGVMSTSHATHVVVDAGWKTFGAEIMFQYRDRPDYFWKNMPSYGQVKARSDLRLARLAAETGWVYYLENARKDLTIGDRLEIYPNSANLVVNLHDKMYGVRNGEVERVIPVTGRGKGS
jgi:D-serine deaminase-like pyridoxal phosphate-dependent protein